MNQTIQKIESRLYPCPFCGSLKSCCVVDNPYCNNPEKVIIEVWIQCMKCGARSATQSQTINPEYFDTVIVKLAQRVANLWDRRAIYNGENNEPIKRGNQ